MEPAVAFRLFIVASIALGFSGALIDALFTGLVSEPLRQAQEAVNTDDLRTQDIALLIIGVPVAIAMLRHPWSLLLVGPLFYVAGAFLAVNLWVEMLVRRV